MRSCGAEVLSSQLRAAAAPHTCQRVSPSRPQISAQAPVLSTGRSPSVGGDSRSTGRVGAGNNAVEPAGARARSQASAAGLPRDSALAVRVRALATTSPRCSSRPFRAAQPRAAAMGGHPRRATRSRAAWRHRSRAGWPQEPWPHNDLGRASGARQRRPNRQRCAVRAQPTPGGRLSARQAASTGSATGCVGGNGRSRCDAGESAFHSYGSCAATTHPYGRRTSSVD